MFGGKEKTQQLFSILNSELQQSITPHVFLKGCFGEISVKRNWKKIGDIEPFKVKVINLPNKLFIKSFCPRAENYAASAYSALNELQTLSLTYPILPVIGKSGNSLFFELGRDDGQIRWESLPDSDMEEISAIVASHGLETLGRFNNLPVINIKGRKYITDAFEDSANSIALFLDKN